MNTADAEPRGHVLVVDDEAPQRDILSTVLDSAGWRTTAVDSSKAALLAAEEHLPDVVLTDLRLGGPDGLELLASLHRLAPGLPVVLMTAHGSIDTAVRAMKEGAYDYLTKPVRRDELLLTIDRAYGTVQLRRENSALRARVEDQDRALVGDGAAMQAVLRLIDKVAPSQSTVLVLGETGTGKEVVARALHARSRRAAGPFVAINCGAIPETLIESELFGHERGAFSGAVARKLGPFERARGGTVFLDEIGDLPLAMQPRLLRVLQEREVQRVGGTGAVPVDVRIIAATHKDLGKLAREGLFREDLFWRLNVFPLTLPPLRERPEDLPALIDHFLTQLARDESGPRRSLEPAALRALAGYRWPGNVRELQSVIVRAWLLADGPTIGLHDLPADLRAEGPTPVAPLHAGAFQLPPEGLSFEELERSILAQAMERSGGVISRAAKLLGMTYRTLQYRLEKFGLRGQPEDPEV